jgi:hypothetical protein
MIAGFQGNRSYIPLACEDTFSRAASADAPGEPFENATPGNCYYLPAGAAFLCSTKVCAW